MAFSTIDKSTLYQNQVLYTGTGSTQSITGVGFQPDLVWSKSRSNTTAQNVIDAVRGVYEVIELDSLAAEGTNADTLTAFGADGFTLGTDGGWNGSSRTYVSWNWKANGSGSANTDGSVASTVSANTTSGFSICTWTGTGSVLTVGHGLGVVPKVMLIKRLNSTGDGVFYHEAMGNAGGMEITSTGAYNAVSGWWNTTSPDTEKFTLGTNGNINTSGGTYVGYCFADISGYSKMGSYTGNGNADGTFVYTGFKPAFIIIKVTSTTDAWQMFDTKRSTFNLVRDLLLLNTSAAEEATDRIDILSNGFKSRTANVGVNSSGASYVYMAFGQPIVSNSGTPATAR